MRGDRDQKLSSTGNYGYRTNSITATSKDETSLIAKNSPMPSGMASGRENGGGNVLN